MSGLKNGYDWAAYYAAAYEKERKHNTMLAGQVADFERKQEDYQDNLERIYASPFWKAVKPLHGMFYKESPVTESDKAPDDSGTDTGKSENSECYIENHTEAQEGMAVDGWREIEVPDSEIVLLTYGWGWLEQGIFEKIKTWFNNNTLCLAAYGDEEFYEENQPQVRTPWHKSDYAPDTLLAYNCWGHLVAVRRDLLSEIAYGGLAGCQDKTKLAAGFYDLCLRLEEAALKHCGMVYGKMREAVRHVDEVFYHGRLTIPLRQEQGGEASENGRTWTFPGAGKDFISVRQEALRRRGIRADLQYGPDPDLYHMVYDTSVSGRERCARAGMSGRAIAPHREVSVVILTKDAAASLERCLGSFRKRTAYRYYKWIVVDSGSGEENRKQMEKLQKDFGFTWLHDMEERDEAALYRLGVEKADGDLLLFLRDDTEIIEKSWLGHMAGQALQSYVGAVGADLWTGDTEKNLQGQVVCGVSAIPAACLMVSREKYEEAGGLCEDSEKRFDSAAFSRRLEEAGYYNVMRNDVAVRRHASAQKMVEIDAYYTGSLQREQARMTAEESLRFYREAYSRELKKGKVLAGKLEEARGRSEVLGTRLGQIKGSIFWRMSKPLRSFVHWMQRTKERIGYCGSVKGFLRKLNAKMIEKKARAQHGTASFPDQAEAARQRSTRFDRAIKFSILMPLYNTPERYLRQAIESVTAQTYENWELCLADGSDEEHGDVERICREYMELDKKYLRSSSNLYCRIVYKKLPKNEGISGNTNECFSMASGDYIALFDHDDVLHPSVLYEYMKAICEKGADYIYCDETTFKGSKTIDHMLTLHFKPDYAPDNLRANNYICHFSAFSRKLLDGTQLFRSEFDGSQDHDMILRLTSRAKCVVHVPKLLYYWRSHEGSVASGIDAKTYAIEAAKGAVADHLRSQGFQNFEITSTKAFETIFRIKYEIQGNPKISIVIPNKDHREDLERCITSILEKSTYDNYEILVVENNSTTKEIFSYYRKIQENPQIRVLNYKGEFNYSRINNLAVSKASGEYILLLNNDTQVITLDWMEELLMYAQRDDVGAVGAKLYYEDKTIQHAGVVLGLGAHRTAGHSHYGIDHNNLGYMGRLCYAQNVMAVTGACLMMRKALFEKLGGLDEHFAVSLNDVDLCVRAWKAGYVNVFTPFAELYHYESVSRGLDDAGEKAQRYDRESEAFREKWKEVLTQGDPYYNPNFSLDRSDFVLKYNVD